MEKKINLISDIENELEVKLSYEEIIPEIEEAYLEEQKTVNLAGFRKGKVPIQMLKKMFGDAIEYKASESIANKIFWKIVEEDSIIIISTPSLSDIDFVRGEKIEFKVRYEVKPKLDLKEYKNIEIEKIKFDFKEEDIEKEIKYIFDSQAIFEETDVVLGENYRITIDLQRLDSEGIPLLGQVSKGMTVSLSDENINKEIRDNSLNKKVGESFNFTFADDKVKDAEGNHEVYNYSVLITKIDKIVTPEPTEEFIKKVSQSKAATLEEYKNMLRANYENYYNSQAENMFINSLLNKVVANNNFVAPKGYVHSVLKNLVDIEIETAKKQKKAVPVEKEARERLFPKAEWNAKWQIILENIAEVENIKVEDKDLEELAEKEAVTFGISAEKLMEYYKKQNRVEALLEDKVIEFLKNNNIAKEVSAAELNKDNQEIEENI